MIIFHSYTKKTQGYWFCYVCSAMGLNIYVHIDGCSAALVRGPIFWTMSNLKVQIYPKPTVWINGGAPRLRVDMSVFLHYWCQIYNGVGIWQCSKTYHQHLGGIPTLPSHFVGLWHWVANYSIVTDVISPMNYLSYIKCL